MTFDECVAADQAAYDRIAAAGGWQRYLDTLPSRKDGWGGRDEGRTLYCSDDRLEAGDSGLCVVGNLLLSERADSVRMCEEANITSIASHQGCASLMILWRRINGLIPPVSQADFDRFVDWETAKLAADLNIAYAGQIPVDRMLGPIDRHASRTVYYSGVADFNPRALFGELPSGFVVSRSFRLPLNALGDLDICLSLALGAAGLGDAITPERPLSIVAIGGRNEGMRADELSQEVMRLAGRYPGRVVVETLEV